jgi:hypothetical protein
MGSIVDVANQLIPPGVVSSSQDFTPLPCVPRDLPHCVWQVHLTVPPAASATFTLAIATTTAGPWRTIAVCTWSAGRTQAEAVPIGVSSSLAAHLDLTAAYLRASVTLRPADGGLERVDESHRRRARVRQPQLSS